MDRNYGSLRRFRVVALLMVVAMLLAPLSGIAAAQIEPPTLVSPEVVYTGTGPTGYEVTFRYYDGNPATTNVKLRGEWYFSDAANTARTSSAGWLPSQWIPGAFPIAFPNSGAGANWPIHPMTQDPETLIWSFTTPMPSGTYTYGFLRNCANANFGSSTGCATSTQIADPNNPPWNTVGANQPTSQVYVPAAPEFGTPDFSWQAPIAVHGTLENVIYESPQSTNPVGYHYVAIYLPPGYDPNRNIAYPTLYVSHGGGGNEIDWSTQGVANRIIDNLIAAGKVQPMVVVMPNFNGIPGGNAGTRNDLISNLIPFVEANYNVSKDASHRAFAGLSMGGSRANDIMFNAPTAFDYIASWSIGASGAPAISDARWDNPDLKTRLAFVVGGGVFDSLTVPGIDTYQANLTMKGIPFIDDRMDGGHSWYVWRQLLYNFASGVAFKHTTTSLSEVAAPGSSAQRAVTFVEATVVASTHQPARLTGKVQFYVDGQVIEPAMPLLPGGTAKVALPKLSAGAHTVTAVYSGDGFYNTSTSVELVVNK